MIDDRMREAIEAMAGIAGWDSFTVLCLICRWAADQGLAAALLEHLAGLADEECDADPG